MAVAPDANLVRSRNATERAILDATAQALAEVDYDRLTMAAIARRAFISRTALYFYFEDKRALVDRLIQRAFSDMTAAASPYLEGDGDPRRELRIALSRVVAVINENDHILLLAARLSGHEGVLPKEWAPLVNALVDGAARRIERDQALGIAPDDIPPRMAAQTLLAMIESHIVREVILGGSDVNQSIRMLAELWWRAVYSNPGEIASRTGT